LNDQGDPSAPSFTSNGKYAAIVVSDGNSDQAMGLYGDNWDKYHEGGYEPIPLTWQIRPDVLQYAPIIAQHLYENRFPTDRFMMGPSGPVYVHYAGIRNLSDLSRLGKHLDAARASTGATLYQASTRFHPTLD